MAVLFVSVTPLLVAGSTKMNPAVSPDASSRYNVIMEGPEIPNIKPPPPTPAMIAKTLANNTSGAAALVDAYGNAYENPMFAYDPVYQV